MHGTGNVVEKDDPVTTTEVHAAEVTDAVIAGSDPAVVSRREKDAFEATAPGDLDEYDKDEEKAKGLEDEDISDFDGATRRNSLSGTPPRIDSEGTEKKLGGDTSPKALEAGFANDKETEDEVIIVDWDGPDDSMNPKKCV